MSAPRVIPSIGSKDVVTFTILVDGEAVPLAIGVLALSVFKEVNKLPYARVEITNGDLTGESPVRTDDELFDLGKTIEISAGYRSEEDLIFRGEIVGHRVRLRQSGAQTLTLLCRHQLYKSTLTKRSATYLETSDSDAISEAFEKYDTSISIAATDLVHEKLYQNQLSDWDFSLQRAAASGLFINPTDDGLEGIFPEPRSEAVITLQMGATILEMDLENDVRSQPIETTMASWDPASQEVSEGKGAEPSFDTVGNQSGESMAEVHGQSFHEVLSGSFSKDELDSFATARHATARLGSHIGRVRCTGTPLVEPGKVVELSGVGERFGGNYLISGIKHAIYEGLWTTDIQLGLKQEPLPRLPKNELSLSQGLHVGLVEALGEDPEGEFRIQVSIPSLGEETSAVWARWISPSASEGFGLAILPEIGDEVVVSFFEGQSTQPVILGSLYSSSRNAPIDFEDDNNRKVYVSRSEMKLEFDEEATAFSIDTPNGNLILVSEEEGGISLTDENGNKLVMNADGILLESTADLEIKAAGDIKISGTNIDTEAASQFTAKGSTGAEVSASGNLVLKGALVQIN